MSDQTDIVIFKPGRDFSAIHIALDPNKPSPERVDEAMNIWNLLTDAYPERDPNATGGHLVGAAKAAGATEVAPAPAPQPQPPAAAPAQPQRAPQQQPQGGGGQYQSRAQKNPPLDGWVCDVCNGPVGRKAMTGGMSSDSAVCLGTCKDGKYVHTVGWLDNVPEVGTDIDPDDLPF